MIRDKSVHILSTVDATVVARRLALWQPLSNGHPYQHVPKQQAPVKSSNLYSSLAGHPNPHVLQPPPPHKRKIAYSSFERVAGAHCDPSAPKCPPGTP